MEKPSPMLAPIVGGYVHDAFGWRAIFLVLAVLTGRMAWDDFRYAELSMGLGVPRWWYTAWVPALSAVISLRVIQALRREIRNG